MDDSFGMSEISFTPNATQNSTNHPDIQHEIETTEQRYHQAELELTKLEQEQTQRRVDMEKLTQQMQHLEQLKRLKNSEKQRHDAQSRMYEAESYKLDASHNFMDAATELANLQEELYEIPIQNAIKPEITELQVEAYMERHDMEQMMEDMLATVIQNMPTYPLPFMISMLRKKSGALPETNLRAALQESEAKFQTILNKTQAENDASLAKYKDSLEKTQTDHDRQIEKLKFDHEKDTTKTQAALARVQDELNKTLSTLENETKSTRKLEDAKERLQDKLTSLQEENQELKRTTQDVKRDLANTNTQAADNRSKLADAITQTKKLQDKLEKQKQKSDNDREKTEQQLRQAKSKIESLEAANTQVRSSDSQHQRKLEEKDRRVHDLEDETLQLKQDLRKAEKKVQELEQKLNASEDLIQELEKNAQAAEEVSKEVDTIPPPSPSPSPTPTTAPAPTPQVNTTQFIDDMSDDESEEEIADSFLQGPLAYIIKTRTGDVRYASTDANVSIRLFGVDGQTDFIKLAKSQGHRDKFERGKSDVFAVDSKNVGAVNSINIGHDGKGIGSGWYLDWVLVQIPSLGKQYRFVADRWLSTSEDDGKINITVARDSSFPEDMHETMNSYTCSTFTGTESGASLDNAKAFIQIYGDKGHSDEIMLDNGDHSNFKDGKQDDFDIECSEIGEVTKVRVWHNAKGVFGATWYLNKVELYDKKREKRYEFEAGRWLDKKHGLDAELPLTKTTLADGSVVVATKADEIVYEVAVKTGDISGAGTDANVFITITGTKGDSGNRHLKKSKANHFSKFERNQNDIFDISSVDLGELQTVKVSRDTNDLIGADWYLESITVKRTTDGSITLFPCDEWLSKKEGLSRELNAASNSQHREFNVVKAKGIEYNITVYTSNIAHAGTDSRVWIQMYGTNIVTGKPDDTGQLMLGTSKEHKDPFQKGSVDSFVRTVNITDVDKIRVGHDNHREGLFTDPSWHLDRIELDAPSLGKKTVFPCEDWLASNKGDGLLEKVLHMGTGGDSAAVTAYKAKKPWQIEVYTSDIKNGGITTDVHGTVFLVDTDGKQTPCELDFEAKSNKKDFEQGHRAVFSFDLEDVGNPIKLRIGHTGAGVFQSNKWHLDKVVMLDKDKNRFEFAFDDWIVGDVDMERGVSSANKLTETDDIVAIEDAGRLSLIPYTIHVKTADTDRAGTDAHIFISLRGEDGGESTSIELSKKNMTSTNKDLFERGKTDEFEVKLVDVGKLKGITMKSDGHRGAHLMYPSWQLDTVTVIVKGSTYTFKCDQQFATKKGIGLEHTFENPDVVMATPSSSRVSSRASSRSSSRSSSLSKTNRKSELGKTKQKPPETPTHLKYKITTWTGTHKNASTDSGVEVTLHGTKGNSAPLRLGKTINKRKDKFENGNDDVFLEGPIPNVGELTAVTLVSDNARGMGHMFSPDWLCDRVEVEEMPGGAKYHFPNLTQRWLSKAKGLKLKLPVAH